METFFGLVISDIYISTIGEVILAPNSGLNNVVIKITYIIMTTLLSCPTHNKSCNIFSILRPEVYMYIVMYIVCNK